MWTTLDLRDVADFTRRGSIITGESMKENPNWSEKLVGHSHRLSATAQSEGSEGRRSFGRPLARAARFVPTAVGGASAEL